MADLYIAGFVATAVAVMLCSAMPSVNAGKMGPRRALAQVFLVALAWPLWLLATIAEAWDW
jgi:hypothetical protein